MIKLGLSIDDDKIEEELPNLEKGPEASSQATASKMEEVDWFNLYVVLSKFRFLTI